MLSIIDAKAEVNARLAANPDAGTRLRAPFFPPAGLFFPFHVDGVSITATSPIKFNKAQMVQLPDKAILVTKVIRNCADTNLSSSLGISIKVNKGWKSTKSQTVTSTNSLKVSDAVEIPGIGKASLDMSWSDTISTTESEDHSENTETTLSINDTVSIKPWTAIRIEAVVIQSVVEIPYSIDVVVNGELWPASPDFDYPHTSAARYLSDAERTFSITGTLRVENSSDASYTIQELVGEVGCPRAAAGEQRNGDAKLVILAATIPEARFVKFSAAAALAEAGNNGPGIGPPDGTHYEVLYTKQLTRGAVECGLNDLGLLNPGNFEIEVRRYSEYVDGNLAREWTADSDETFIDCVSV